MVNGRERIIIRAPPNTTVKIILANIILHIIICRIKLFVSTFYTKTVFDLIIFILICVENYL